MKRWQRQLDEHPLTSSLAQIEEILSQGISTTDQIQNYEFVRLSKIIKRTKDSIKQLDPEFAPVDQMHSVQNFIINHNIVSQVHDSINNKNYSTLTSINNSFDGVMSQINLINKSITRSNSSKIDHAISSAHLQRFIALIAKEQTQMNILYQERQREINSISQQSIELIQKLKNKEKDFNEKTIDLTNQLNETNITAKKEFSETKIKLDTEVNNKVNEIRSSYVSKIEELLSDFKERISERSSITDDKLNHVEEEANSKLDKIVQLYGLAARDSVTGGHKQIADNEGIYANKWRRATVLIILATIGWLFYSLKFYNPITSNDRDFWFSAAKSLSLTTIMISFAVYASKQAALHRLNEKKSRSFFLQVQAFDPFIQDLPDSVRQELKRNISERIFSGDNSESDKLLLDNSDYKSLDKTLEIMESLKRIFSTDK